MPQRLRIHWVALPSSSFPRYSKLIMRILHVLGAPVLVAVVAVLGCGTRSSASAAPATSTSPKAAPEKTAAKAATAKAAAKTATAKTTPPLDSAGQILEAAIAAGGGRETKQKRSAMRATGAVRLPQLRASGRMELLWAAPRKLQTTGSLPPLGRFSSGSNGALVWEQTPLQGYRLLSGAEAAQRLLEATFNGDLQWKSLYTKVELVASETIAGVAAHKVVATTKDDRVVTLYFAKDSALPLATMVAIETATGSVSHKTFYADYRSVDGIQVPFRTTIQQGPLTIETVFDHVEWDPVVPADAFAVPAEIRALQKR